MFDYRGQVVLVTGAATGIGRATAEAWARAGAFVVVADINDGDAETTVAHCRGAGGGAEYVRCDVGDAAAVEALVDGIIARHGRLDCAFNNAGTEGTPAHIADVDPEVWARTIRINLSGTFYCMHHEARVMRAAGRGAIVNCASIAGVVGFATASAYCASKHGVVGLTKAAALDLGPLGIRVNALCPAFIETAMLDRAGMTADPVLRTAMEGLHALNRYGRPEEMSDIVLWLCSPHASFVTGHAMLGDGGYVAR
jgi:NAD(P)-dependent dehydrogenase (short-subunit alcohol dehydrogenase family)